MHRTGLDACAEAARAGTIADPRGLDVPRDFASEDEVWFAQPMLRPSAGLPALPRPNGLASAGITGPMRGTVLLKLGDQVTVDRILPWGARVRPSRLDVVALAEDSRSPASMGAERAASHAGGCIAPVGVRLRDVARADRLGDRAPGAASDPGAVVRARVAPPSHSARRARAAVHHAG
jgi:hypothetical protein